MPTSQPSKCSQQIDGIDITPDTLTDRGGLALFARYLRGIQIAPHLDRLFGSIRKSAKGLAIVDLFMQLLCFLVDGTSRHLTRFDELAADPGYAATIETDPSDLASSHTIKRFLKSFGWVRIWLFRRLLQRLMIWRLRLEQPDVIELGIDTMIMDNSCANVRHGVEPTYKGVKGFQPLQMTWKCFIVDAVFRGGSKHSNHGHTVKNMVEHVVKRIRRSYREDVAIVVRCDAGFFDQKLFRAFEALGIGFICSGKRYDDIKRFVAEARQHRQPHTYTKDGRTWGYVEFGNRRKSWQRTRRAFYCWPIKDGSQLLLPFSSGDRVYYTNLGMGDPIDEKLREAGAAHLLTPRGIIASIHGRGNDELVHRALKDFASETLPFKGFAPNAALYYTILLAFFLYEAFKRDVTPSVISTRCYATTFRRRIIDIAAKIVRHAGRITLKVTEACWNRLQLDTLWQLSGNPPQFAWR